MDVSARARDRLKRWFHWKERRATLSGEVRGAVATFLAMCYILVANPAILSAAGLPFHSAVACTALAAGICSILMGLVGKFPLAMASGMGLNSLIAFQIAPAVGGWRTAMGLVILDGVVVLLLVWTGFRESVMHAIPKELKLAIGSGIGLFIAFIGLINCKLVVVPFETVATLAKHPGLVLPPVSFGGIHSLEAKLAIAGLIVTAALLVRRIKGALIVGMLFGAGIGLFTGLSHWPEAWVLPDFSNAFQADVLGALKLRYLPLVLSLILVDFFDTLGTVSAIADQGRLHDERGQIPNLKRILEIDAISASIGGVLGASSVTAYVESSAGVAEGARTGVSAIIVGILFILCIFFAPLASIVPIAATSPALILVGFLMSGGIRGIPFDRVDIALPAFLTIITIPLTFSIAHGIGLGFISYVLIKIVLGKYREVSPILYLISALFLAGFVFN